MEVHADLVVAADGRQSIVREKAGLPVQEFGAPMDVLWFRLSRKRDDPAQTMGRFDTGRIFISINRGITGNVVTLFRRASSTIFASRGSILFAKSSNSRPTPKTR